jgi:O-antigen/teichoic acid export membrane protein
MNQFSKGIVKGVAWNFLGNGWIMAAVFFSTPYIVHTLNLTVYGIYSLSGLMIGYLSFLQFGLGAATVKFIAQYLAEKNSVMIRKVFWASVYFYCFVGLAGVALVFALSGVLVQSVFRIPDGYKDLAVQVLNISACGFLLTLLNETVKGTLKALSKFDVLMKINIVFRTVQIGSALLLLWSGRSVIAVILAALAVQAVECIVSYIAAVRYLPVIARPAGVRGVLRKMLGYGGFVTVSGIISPILSDAEKIFLNMFYPVSLFAYYSVPFSFVSRLAVIPSSFAAVIFPAASYLEQANERKSVEELHYRGTLYTGVMYAFFLGFFLVFGREFLAAWMGADFGGKSWVIFEILLAAGFINAVAYPSAVVLNGVGKPHLPALFHCCELALYLPAGYFLIKTHGAAGAAAAWLLRVCVDTLLLQYAACAFLGSGHIPWLFRLLRRGILPVAAGVFLFWALKKIGLPFMHIGTFAGIAAVALAYAAIVWRFCLDDQARGRLREFAQGFGK